MESKMMGRGSFVVLWGSAAAWLADRSLPPPRDVDVIRGAFGGAPLPSEADVAELLRPFGGRGSPGYCSFRLDGRPYLSPAEDGPLVGLPIDLKTCHEANYPHGRVLYFAGDSAWYERPGPSGHEGCRLRLPVVEGQQSRFVILRTTGDAYGMGVEFRPMRPEESLSTAIRAGAIAGTTDALIACVRRWLDGNIGQIHLAHGMRCGEAEVGTGAYTGSGLDAIDNARRHVSDAVWDEAAKAMPLLAFLNRALSEDLPEVCREELSRGAGAGVPTDAQGRTVPSPYVTSDGLGLVTREGVEFSFDQAFDEAGPLGERARKEAQHRAEQSARLAEVSLREGQRGPIEEVGASGFWLTFADGRRGVAISRDHLFGVRVARPLGIIRQEIGHWEWDVSDHDPREVVTLGSLASQDERRQIVIACGTAATFAS